jgi:hypothetical protein
MKLTKFILLAFVTITLFSQVAKCTDSEDADSLKHANADNFTRESFFAEYDQESPEHPEVKMAKKYFPTRETTINVERYKTLLKMYMDGTVHDEEIDEDIREEAHAQLEEFVEAFIDQEAKEKDEFTVEDLFTDFIGGAFHEWLDKAHPQHDDEIEPDL